MFMLCMKCQLLEFVNFYSFLLKQLCKSGKIYISSMKGILNA